MNLDNGFYLEKTYFIFGKLYKEGFIHAESYDDENIWLFKEKPELEGDADLYSMLINEGWSIKFMNIVQVEDYLKQI